MRLCHLLERWALILETAASERPSEVLPGQLYVGSALAARSFVLLRHMGIRHVITLCPADLLDPEAEQASDFDYLMLPVRREWMGDEGG